MGSQLLEQKHYLLIREPEFIGETGACDGQAIALLRVIKVTDIKDVRGLPFQSGTPLRHNTRSPH